MMKTNSPTHEEIARCAHKIWHSRGGPSGYDNAIWFEAERQLRADLTGAVAAEPVVGSWPKKNVAPVPDPDAIAAKAAFQKQAARAPQLQHGKNAPKAAPVESGKPLWDKPHSS